MAIDPWGASGARKGLTPRPIGVYCDQVAAFLVLSEEDRAFLADHRRFQVLRGKKLLGLAVPGDARPLFVVDLEAEFDLRISSSIDVLVIDLGVMRKCRITICLVWP